MDNINIFNVSANRAGFWSAMASNLTNQSRNVLSKKFMVKKEVSLYISICLHIAEYKLDGYYKTDSRCCHYFLKRNW